MDPIYNPIHWYDDPAQGNPDLNGNDLIDSVGGGRLPIEELYRKLNPGKYYFPLHYPEQGESQADSIAADVLEAVMWIQPRKMTWDRIGAFVNAAAVGGLMRVGIYTDNGSFYPDALVVESGALDASAGGWKEGTISQQLERDLYWIAVIVNDGTIDLRTALLSDIGITPYGKTAVGADNIGLTVAQAYGAMPATFPAGAAEMLRGWSLAMRHASND